MVLSVVPHSVYPEIINISGDDMNFFVTMSSGVVGRVDIIADERDVEVWMGSGTFANIGHIRWSDSVPYLLDEDIGVRTNNTSYLDSDSYTYMHISGTTSFTSTRIDYDHTAWRYGNVILQQKGLDRIYSYYIHRNRDYGGSSSIRIRRTKFEVNELNYSVTGSYSEITLPNILTTTDYDKVFLYKTDVDDNEVFVANTNSTQTILYKSDFSGTGTSSTLATIDYSTDYTFVKSQIYDQYLYVLTKYLQESGSYILTFKHLKIDMTTGDYSEGTIGSYSGCKYHVVKDSVCVPKPDGDFIWGYLCTNRETSATEEGMDEYVLLYGDNTQLLSHKFWERSDEDVHITAKDQVRFAGENSNKSYIIVTAQIVSGNGWYTYFNDTLSLTTLEYANGDYLKTVIPLSAKTGNTKYYLAYDSSIVSIVNLETNVIYKTFVPADYGFYRFYPTSYFTGATQIPKSDIDINRIFLQATTDIDDSLGLIEISLSGNMYHVYNIATTTVPIGYIGGQEVIISNGFCVVRFTYTNVGNEYVYSYVIYTYSTYPTYVRKPRT